jgi:hypothetical protein
VRSQSNTSTSHNVDDKIVTQGNYIAPTKYVTIGETIGHLCTYSNLTSDPTDPKAIICDAALDMHALDCLGQTNCTNYP